VTQREADSALNSCNKHYCEAD